MRIFGLTLGDWRTHSTKSANIFSHLHLNKTPGVYLLSARASGFKGIFSGARHSWISIFDGKNWTSIEITDAETLSYQTSDNGKKVTWNCYGAPSKSNDYRCIFRSNRIPDGYWFGQRPKLEMSLHSNFLIQNFINNLEYYCQEYPFQEVYTLIDNNCSKFISYLLWRNNAFEGQKKNDQKKIALIGFQRESYWKKLAESENQLAQVN